MRASQISRFLLIAVVLASLSLLFQLLLPLFQFRHPLLPVGDGPVGQWRAHDSHLNISLDLSGRCRAPVVYLGVDSRTHLLSHYDISALPTEKYSKWHINWARVVLLNVVMKMCKETTWFVYSDTDAYVPSRRQLIAKLAHMEANVVFQHGMWFVNSGFHAWRNDNISRLVLTDWNRRYTNSTNFFAEQKAMLEAVKRYRKHTKETHNGFLGWHVKGPVRFKTDVANAGRMGCQFEDTWIAISLTTVVVTGVAALFVLLRWRIYKLETPRLVSLYNAVASERILLIVLTFVLAILHFLADPRFALRDPRDMSAHNPIHLFSKGHRILDTKAGLLCDRFWCIKKGHQYRFWKHVSKSKRLTLLTFIVSDFIDKTAGNVLVAIVVLAWVCLFVLASVDVGGKVSFLAHSRLRPFSSGTMFENDQAGLFDASLLGSLNALKQTTTSTNPPDSERRGIFRQ